MNPAWRFLLPLFGLWLLLYGSYALGRPPLPDGPNTLHAEIAREMISRNDWTTPYWNGAPAKTSSRPLDWAIAASFRLFGAADWSARLPIALCVLGLAVTVFFFGRTLFGWNAAGLYAALLLLAWPGTFLATRELTSTPFFSLATALFALVLWLIFVASKASLSKAIAISVLAAVMTLLFTGSWPNRVLLLMVLALIWYARGADTPLERARRLLFGWAAWAFILPNIWPYQPPAKLITHLAVVPPLALLLGGWLANNEAFAKPATGQRVARYIFAIGLFVSAMAVFLAIHGPVSLTSFNSHSVFIVGGSSRIPSLIAATALLAGITGNLICRLRDNARVANCFLAGLLAGLIVAIQAGLVLGSPRVSSQILADAIRPELDPADIVMIDGSDADASSFVFYLEHSVKTASSASGAPDPASSLQSEITLDRDWTGTSRVFLWTSAKHPLAVPGGSYVVASSGGKEILSNQPNSAGANF